MNLIFALYAKREKSACFNSYAHPPPPNLNLEEQCLCKFTVPFCKAELCEPKVSVITSYTLTLQFGLDVRMHIDSGIWAVIQGAKYIFTPGYALPIRKGKEKGTIKKERQGASSVA